MGSPAPTEPTVSEALNPIRNYASAFAGAVMLAVVGMLSDNRLSTVELANLVLLGLTAGAVYAVGHRGLKKGTAIAMAVVQLLITSLGVEGGLSDLTTAHWVNLAFVGLSTAGIVFVPNKGAEPSSATDPTPPHLRGGV